MSGWPSAVLLAALAVTAAGCARSGDQAASNRPAAVSGTALGDRERGAQVFRANCAVCHTTDGSPGGVGPSLQNEKQRKNYEQTVAWIEQPDPPMPKLYPAPLSQKDVEDVAAYVQSL
jgi:mono/diheme cytochrome c family protein